MYIYHKFINVNAILVFAVADAPTIEAKHLNDDETRLFLLKNNLKLPLQIAGDWRWKD